MRRSLGQIQLWNNEDPDLGNAFDKQQESIKDVSDNIKLWWDIIYEHMCQCINDHIPVNNNNVL